MPSHPSEPKTLAGDPRPSGQPARDAGATVGCPQGRRISAPGGVLCHGALLKWSSQPDQVTKGNTKVVCTIGGENGILVSGWDWLSLPGDRVWGLSEVG
jgi:hypothetical protein